MAVGNTLVLKFGTASGERTFSFKYGNASARASDIKALMNAMITNGSIYKTPPLTIVSAKVQVVTETEFDLSD